jgi:hypothetical protein
MFLSFFEKTLVLYHKPPFYPRFTNLKNWFLQIFDSLYEKYFLIRFQLDSPSEPKINDFFSEK